MKRLTVLFCLLLGIVSGVLAEQKIRVGVGDGLEPFETLVAAVYKEMGYVPVFTVVPSVRSLTGADSGEFDADIGRAAGATATYKNLVMTTESLLDLHLMAVTKEGFLTAPIALKDLSKYKIGYVRGSKLADAISVQLALKPEMVNDVESVARMVTAGRIEVALMSSAAPITLAGDLAKGLVTQKEVLVTSKTYHVFNREFADLVPKFDAVVKTMKADGRWPKLLAASFSQVGK